MKKALAIAIAAAGLVSLSAFAADQTAPAATPNPTSETQSGVKPSSPMKTAHAKKDKMSKHKHAPADEQSDANATAK